MTDKNKTLACPECKNPHGLATIERLHGKARCGITTDHDDYDGSTEVWWDSSESIGVTCDCGWDYTGDDWRSQLVPVPDEKDEPITLQLTADEHAKIIGRIRTAVALLMNDRRTGTAEDLLEIIDSLQKDA